jgi:hypothetical protein
MELHTLNSSQNIIRIIRPRQISKTFKVKHNLVEEDMRWRQMEGSYREGQSSEMAGKAIPLTGREGVCSQ